MDLACYCVTAGLDHVLITEPSAGCPRGGKKDRLDVRVQCRHGTRSVVVAEQKTWGRLCRRCLNTIHRYLFIYYSLMSWFGFGGSKSSEPSPASSGDQYNAQWNEPSSGNFDSHNNYSAPSGRSLQEEIQLEAQKVEIQGLILQLTNTAFDKCVSKPGSSLSHSEKSCIEATTGKYIESKGLLMQKLTGGHWWVGLLARVHLPSLIFLTLHFIMTPLLLVLYKNNAPLAFYPSYLTFTIV